MKENKNNGEKIISTWCSVEVGPNGKKHRLQDQSHQNKTKSLSYLLVLLILVVISILEETLIVLKVNRKNGKHIRNRKKGRKLRIRQASNCGPVHLPTLSNPETHANNNVPHRPHHHPRWPRRCTTAPPRGSKRCGWSDLPEVWVQRDEPKGTR